MTQQGRREIVKLVSKSPHTVAATVAEIGVSKSSFYRWRAQMESGPADDVHHQLRASSAAELVRL